MLASIAVLTVIAASAVAVALAVLTGRIDLGRPPASLASSEIVGQLSSSSVDQLPDGDTDLSIGDSSRQDGTATGPIQPAGSQQAHNRGSSLLGSPGNPFPTIAADGQSEPVRAIRTANGLVLPVVEDDGGSWQVSTACENVVRLTRGQGQPIGPAHVVLDAGHGGTEPGAVGPSGLTEKEINLAVVHRTRDRLEEMGASVVLTREFDHNITTAARGRIAVAVDPALFVSVHHNGGAPAGGDLPGTMAFTKAGSQHASRFGGLFFDYLQPVLERAADERRAAYEQYVSAVSSYEDAVDAYDRTVAARDAALVANGQLPPTATTVPSPRDTNSPPTPRERAPQFTTTLPPTQSTTVPVPTTAAPPQPLQIDPVQPFSFAGSGNRGVRAWIRPDGRDYLSVLRNSGDVPAVLVEYLYLTNPAEEALLSDDNFLDAQAEALVDAIVAFFSSSDRGTGFVADQYDDQPIGGGGGADGCVEPDLRSAESTN